MRTQRLIQCGAVLLAIVFMVLAGQVLRPIDSQRHAMGLSAIQGAADMPADMAFTSLALGGFRGLAVDYFWIRAEMLRQEGRYYEANQLAHWICKLQPRFVRVWSFHAWNLAYNMSVLTQTFKERWNWVHNGIKLLRDEGLRYNPYAIGLYRDLGWLFFHKMGDFMDEYHLGYKRQWAWNMHRLLGEPPPDLQAEGAETQLARILAEKRAAAQSMVPLRPEPIATAEEVEAQTDKSVQRVIDWFTPIAEAPRSWEALVADEQMASFVQRCEQAGIKLRKRPIASSVIHVVGEPEVNTEFFDEYQVVLTPSLRQQFDLQAGHITLTPDAKALSDLLQDPETRPLVDRLLAFMRRYVLVHVYKMDPDWMLSLMKRFGPIDWRLPDAHGMYWSSYGVKKVEEAGVKDVEEFFGPNTPLNTDRMMMFALQRMTLQGRLFFEPNIEQVENSVMDIVPDLRFVDATHKAYVAVASKYDPDAGPIAGEDFRDGHQNYLRDVLRYFYLYGQHDIAGYYYEYLRRNYRLRDGEINEAYLVPLAEFVLDPEFTERLSDPRIAEAAIHSYLYQAFRLLVMGESDKATNLVKFARDRIYEWYRKSREDNPSERMKLPPFDLIFSNAVAGWLVAPGSQEMLFVKARLWKSMPIDTQLAIYDDVIGPLGQMASAFERQGDLDALFPAPPGIEQYREAVARCKKAAEDTEDISAGELLERARQGQMDRGLPKMPSGN